MGLGHVNDAGPGTGCYGVFAAPRGRNATYRAVGWSPDFNRTRSARIAGGPHVWLARMPRSTDRRGIPAVTPTRRTLARGQARRGTRDQTRYSAGYSGAPAQGSNAGSRQRFAVAVAKARAPTPATRCRTCG